jgi:DNA polymerase
MIKEQFIELKKQCYACKQCGLCDNFVGGEDPHVFSYGNIHSPVMFIGMNPGKDEVKQKKPFVGKSGQLLDELLTYAGIESRKTVFISNICKCYTIGLREPTPKERNACSPFLAKEIELLKPKLLVPLGNFALEALTGSRSIMNQRGRIIDTKYDNISIFPSLHPSAALRKGSNKELMVEDFKQLGKILQTMEN